jgi:hypothetical protein
VKRRTILRLFGFGLIGLVIVIAAPVIVVESACHATPDPKAPIHSPRFAITDPEYRRAETNSYLSYPEWYIVYAYQDFAATLHEADEWRFNYLTSIADFWTGFCGVNRVASAKGGGPLVEKVMIYVIGDSFTAEMAIKGSYETTIGHLSALIRGPEKTLEDLLAERVADTYAAFLQQAPWYEYSFGTELKRLWRETPFGGPSRVRSVERRIALSMEWGVKAVYARAIGAAAGLSPAALHIESVVHGVDQTDLQADPRIAILRDLGDGNVLIDTPRYGAFTEIVAGLAERDRQMVEIAGNSDVLVTALLPPGIDVTMTGVIRIFSDEDQSRPGWHRVGLETEVPRLTALIVELGKHGAIFEHVYDY